MDGSLEEMAIGNWSINRKTTGGLVLVLGILAGTSASFYLDFNDSKIEARVRNTYKVFDSNQQLIHLVADAKTGQRGYLLTLENRYLESHRTAIKRLAPEIKQLRQLTVDNFNQQQQVDALKPLVQDLRTINGKPGISADEDPLSSRFLRGNCVSPVVVKLAELQQTISLRLKSLEAALHVSNTNQGQQLRQKIHKLSNEIAIPENLAVAVVVVKLS